MIYGERIRHAREALDENQTQFAREVGLTQPRLSQIEKGYVAPSPLVLAAISVHTQLPVEWFELPPSAALSEGSLLFRARTSLRAGQRQQAIRCAQTVWEHAHWMLEQFEFPPCEVPEHGGVEPRVAARHTRGALGLPAHGPIPNVVLALERAGLLVLALPLAYEKHDAFSTWVRSSSPAYPLVALLAGAPGDRRRFSLAHELAHLVLHRDVPPSATVGVEAEADIFASEFLVPLDDLADELAGRPTLNEFVMLKRRWGASLQVLIRAARSIGVLDDDRYTNMFKQLSARGWRKDQPVHVPVEKPRAYRKMAELTYGDPIDLVAMARDAAWLPPFAGSVIEQHASLADLPRRSLPPPNVIDLAVRQESRLRTY